MQSTPVGFGANNSYASPARFLPAHLKPGTWNTFAGTGTPQQAVRAVANSINFGNTQSAQPHKGSTKSWMA